MGACGDATCSQEQKMVSMGEVHAVLYAVLLVLYGLVFREFEPRDASVDGFFRATAEMMNRLQRHEQGHGNDSEDETAEDDASSDSEGSPADFSSLCMLELREECKRRGLAQYGTREGAPCCRSCSSFRLLVGSVWFGLSCI